MKLTAKLVAIFTAVVMLMSLINGYISMQQEINQFERESRDEAEIVALQIENLFPHAIERCGVLPAIQLLEKHNLSARNVHVRYVEFAATRGGPFQPEAPPEMLQEIQSQSLLRYEVERADGGTFVDYYWAMTEQVGPRRGGLEISKSTAPLQTAKGVIIRSTLWQMLATIVVSGLMVYLAGLRIVGHPLKKLVEKTKRVSEGDMTGPIDLGSHDELGDLAMSLNVMTDKLSSANEKVLAAAADRIETTQQLRHADRLHTVGKLASGMAHELGTPLNVVSGRANMIASGKLTDEEIVGSAETIKSEADRMTGIIQNLLDFARRGNSQHTTVDLRQLVTQVLDLLSYLGEKHGIRLQFNAPDTAVEASIDQGQLQQVLTNLIVNAGQSMPEGGTVNVTLCTRQAIPPQGVDAVPGIFRVIEVADQGEGIDPQNLENIFDPFFTTKEIGKGTGLGLSIAHGIVQDHGGWISVSSQLGKGSTFSVFIPQESQT